MGTSGSYSGAGGKAGKDVTSGLGDWSDGCPTDHPSSYTRNVFPPGMRYQLVA